MRYRMTPQQQPPVTAGKGRDFDIVDSCLGVKSVMVLDREEDIPARTLRRDGSLQGPRPHGASTGPTSNSFSQLKYRSLQQFRIDCHALSGAYTSLYHAIVTRRSLTPTVSDSGFEAGSKSSKSSFWVFSFFAFSQYPIMHSTILGSIFGLRNPKP